MKENTHAHAHTHTHTHTHTHVSSQQIKWQLIYELSPWMGGFYRKNIGKIRLTSNQLHVLLVAMEATLNQEG